MEKIKHIIQSIINIYSDFYYNDLRFSWYYDIIFMGLTGKIKGHIEPIMFKFSINSCKTNCYHIFKRSFV